MRKFGLRYYVLETKKNTFVTEFWS